VLGVQLPSPLWSSNSASSCQSSVEINEFFYDDELIDAADWTLGRHVSLQDSGGAVGGTSSLQHSGRHVSLQDSGGSVGGTSTLQHSGRHVSLQDSGGAVGGTSTLQHSGRHVSLQDSDQRPINKSTDAAADKTLTAGSQLLLLS